MKVYILCLSLIVLCTITNISLAAEQLIVFNVENFRYGNFTDKNDCETKCSAQHTAGKMDQLLKNDWRIVTSSPKEVIVAPFGSYVAQYNIGSETRTYGCACQGTEYVLQKDDSASLSSKNDELLKKKNEILERENDLLKQENANLKRQLNQKKSKTKK